MAVLQDQRRILVIKHGALGDLVIAFLAFQTIRQHHPAATITLLTTAPYAELARTMPWFDQVWIDSRPRWWQPLAWLRLVRRVAGARFDRVYDLQGSDRTGLLFRLLPSSARPEWAGPVKGASHPRPPRAGEDEHIRAWVARNLRAAGLEPVARVDFGWLDGEVGRFGLPERFVLLVPGSSPQRPEKRWPADRYAALGQGLLDRGITPVLIGSAGENDLGRRILAACPGAVALMGRTALGDLAALARRALGAVGNDTGPMHLIAPLGCPTLVLFSGHSDPRKICPVGPSVRILRRDSLDDLPVSEVAAAFDALPAVPSVDRAS